MSSTIPLDLGSDLATENAADFGVEFNVPPAARVTQIVDLILTVLFTNKAMRMVWTTALGVLVAIGITRPARAGTATWVQILVIVGIYLLFDPLLLSLIQRFAGRGTLVNRLMYGRPAFGVMGGPQQRDLSLCAKSKENIHIEFGTDDENLLVDVVERFNLRALEVNLRVRYDEAVRNGEIDPARDPWQEVWQKLLSRRISNTEFRDIGRSWVSGAVLLRVRTTETLCLPLVSLYCLGVAWFMVRTSGEVSARHVLVTAQVALLGSLVIALVLYLNHVQVFGVVLLNPDELVETVRPTIPEELLEEYEEHLKRSQGKVLNPIAITINPGFIKAIRDYYARNEAILAALHVPVLVALVVASLVTGVFISSHSPDELVSRSLAMTVGFLLLPIVIVLGSSLGFMILQHLSEVSSLLISGLLLLVVPPVLAYSLTGQLPDKSVTLTTSIVTGVIGAVATALAETARKRA